MQCTDAVRADRRAGQQGVLQALRGGSPRGAQGGGFEGGGPGIGTGPAASGPGGGQPCLLEVFKYEAAGIPLASHSPVALQPVPSPLCRSWAGPSSDWD